MKPLSRTARLLVVIPLAFAFPAMALSNLPAAEVRCDTNKDGKISGSERAALTKLKSSATLNVYDADCSGDITQNELAFISQQAAKEVAENNRINAAAIAVEAGDPAIELPPTETQKPTKKPRWVISRNKVAPSVELIAKSGAILSFTEDHISGSNSLAVDGVITYLLTDPDAKRPTKGPFGDFNITAYLDLQGSVKSDGDNVTSAVLGLDYLFDIQPGRFDLQSVSIGPYYQTDFKGKAEAYGLTVSWTPVKTSWQLGQARKRTGNILEHLIWDARAEVDYRSVRKTGETQLVKGDQFWAGFSLGAQIYPFGELGSMTPFIDLGIETRRNLINGDDATLSSVSFNYPLSTKGNSLATVSYENGEKYRTGEKTEKTTVGLSFKF